MKTITLKNLAEATEQEVFDQIKNHLLTQNRKSLSDKDGFCRYRSELENGTVLKCAAGCLIADDEYDPKFDSMFDEHADEVGTGWLSIIDRFNISNNHSKLISILQGIHDDFDLVLWTDELKRVAEDFGLKYE